MNITQPETRYNTTRELIPRISVCQQNNNNKLVAFLTTNKYTVLLIYLLFICYCVHNNESWQHFAGLFLFIRTLSQKFCVVDLRSETVTDEMFTTQHFVRFIYPLFIQN